MRLGLRLSLVLIATAMLAVASSCGDPSGTVGLAGADTLRFAAIAAGGRHSCALDAEGVAYCWGHGFEGQTGLGPTGLRSSPRALDTGLRFSSITAGSQSTCAVERGRTGVYCWGVLGGGSVPALIDGSAGAEEVTLEVDHACIRFEDGGVGCFGSADFGQLGPGAPPGPDLVTSVVMVPGLSAVGSPAVGQRHSCALAPDGTVSCWGMHEGGQLGIGETTEECPIGPQGEPRPCAALPTSVGSGPYIAVAAGLYHTCALRDTGQVECWGDDESGQLGLETGGTESCDWLISDAIEARSCTRSPIALASDLTFSHLRAGYFHTCGIEGDGEAQCWGTDTFGQTGGQGRPGRPGPVAGNHRWATIAAGQLHTCGVTESGAAYCWGDGQYGQLGSSSEFAAEPLLVTGF